MQQKWKNHVVITANEAVNTICSPLKHLSIDGFFFMRIFPNGTFIDLATDLHWTNHFLSNYFSGYYNFETVKRHMVLEDNIDIWSLSEGNEFYEEARNNFSVKEGLSITYNEKNWKDVFCYYIKKENKLSLLKLIGLLDFLRKFSDYFLEKASDILKEGQKNPLFIPQSYRKIFLSPKSPLSSELLKAFSEISESSDIFFPGFVALTKQEVKCIRAAAKGLSYHEICKMLVLSRRTVESYIMSARNKTNCKNITELVYFYHLTKQLF